MRLTDLDPRWRGASTYQDPERKRHGLGIHFLCPVHRDHYLGVPFANPIDGGSAVLEYHTDGPPTVPANLWQRSGDSFETLTLTPSVDASKCMDFGSPCWHGFITNGEIR